MGLNVIIAGCGRVGAQLATSLSTHDHAVSIIDKNPAAFRRLGREFNGQTVAGVVFDREVLARAGIRRAQAFVAVTSGDNSNVVSARVAHEHYGVERVVARIYDPERAVIYERLNIHTIASARWTAEAALRILLPSEAGGSSAEIGNGDVTLLAIELSEPAAGVTVEDVRTLPGVALAAVTSEGRTRVPPSQALLRSGDVLHLAVEQVAVDRVRGMIANLAPAGGAGPGDDAHGARGQMRGRG